MPGTISLDAIVPGGQTVYVDADGSLSFAAAHTRGLPDGATDTPFTYTPAPSNGTVGNLSFGSNGEGFFACPTNGTFPYQVLVATAGDARATDCIGINLATSTFTGDEAWQYE